MKPEAYAETFLTPDGNATVMIELSQDSRALSIAEAEDLRDMLTDAIETAYAMEDEFYEQN